MPSIHRRLTPDAYAAAAMVVAIAGEVLLPLALLPPAAVTSPVSWAGGLVALVGLALETAAAQALTRAGTTTRPNAAPDALVSGGPFRWSRNPFYLGLVLVLAGLMLALSLDWFFLAVPLLWLALDRLVVPREEAALAAGFGADWHAYRGRTRRWF